MKSNQRLANIVNKKCLKGCMHLACSFFAALYSKKALRGVYGGGMKECNFRKGLEICLKIHNLYIDL